MDAGVRQGSAEDVLVHVAAALGFVACIGLMRAALDALTRLLAWAKLAELTPALQREALVFSVIALPAMAVLRHDATLELRPLLRLMLLTFACYLLLMAIVVASAALVCSRWDAAEQLPAETVQLELERLQQTGGRGGEERPSCYALLRRAASLRRAHAFHELRGNFLVQNGLLADFPFAAYLRECMASRLARLLRPHVGGWLAAGLLVAGRELLIDPAACGDAAAAAGRIVAFWLTVFSSALACVAIACLAIVRRAHARLAASQRYWSMPYDCEARLGTRGGRGRSSEWLTHEQRLAGRAETADAERRGGSFLARAGESLLFIPPEAPAAAPSAAWAESGCDAPDADLRAGAAAPPCCTWTAACALGWRRVRWAPSVFLSGTPLLEHLHASLWLALAAMLAIIISPAGSGCGDVTPLAMIARVSAAYLALPLAPEALSACALLSLLESYSIVSATSVHTRLESTRRLSRVAAH